MLASFSAFETMVEEALNRGGKWLFEFEEIDRIGELQTQFKVRNPALAIKALKSFIRKYFEERRLLPVLEITLDPPAVRIFSREGAEFLMAAKALRGDKTAGKQFEDLVAKRLAAKLTGRVMNVGYPRRHCPTADYMEQLRELGIDASKFKKIKDGGMDVIWIPPLGKKSEIPFLNFQCKNTEVIGNDVKISLNDFRRTSNRHELFTNSEFLVFIVVNTYLDKRLIEASSKRGYVCLGLPELLASVDIHPPAVYL